MNAPTEPLKDLARLAGAWVGVNRLWFEPGDPVRESPSTAVIEGLAQGRGLTIRYTWASDGAPQDGLLLVMPAGGDDPALAFRAVLVDSWHVGDGYMACEGGSGAGIVSVRGSYGAPEGPDWGWRTTIETLAVGWRLRMYNIEPTGEETLAVEGVYELRAGPLTQLMPPQA